MGLLQDVAPINDQLADIIVRSSEPWIEMEKDMAWIKVLWAGEESGRHLVMWEYESLTAFESYKARRKDYEGPYAEYKVNDPYYKGVFDHSRMKMEFWNDIDRDLWIE